MSRLLKLKNTSKTALKIDDVSNFARALSAAVDQRTIEQVATKRRVLTHTQWLNLIAKAAGYQNYQSLKAHQESPLDKGFEPLLPQSPINTAHLATPSVDLTESARKTLKQFDAAGRLVRLPNKFSIQRLAVWCLWTRFAQRRVYSEAQVNTVLKAYNTFGDHVTLRRELVEAGLLVRKDDCSEYRKVALKPPVDVALMLKAYHQQSSAPQASGEDH